MIKLLKIVDLSLPLNADTPIYPDDPKPKISVATTLKNEGYNLFNVMIGTQTGSHIDAPYHFNNDGATVDKIDLKQCFGTGFVIDVSHKNGNEEINLDDITPYSKDIENCDIVLFKTNWEKHIGTDEFYNHPYLNAEGARYLLDKGIKTVAIDTINLDQTGGTTFPVHAMFAAEGALIAENLTHFSDIDFKNPIISILPLNLTGCDGSPIRAVAMHIKSTSTNI